MLHLLALIFSSLTTIHAAVIFQPASISLNATDSLLANTTNTPDPPHVEPPDADFRVDPSFGTGFLPVNDTLMGVLFFMAEIAYEDYYEDIEPGIWSAPGYSEINIMTTETIKAKYLIWGMFYGIEYLVKNVRFNSAQFNMRIGKEKLGAVWIISSDQKAQIQSSAQNGGESKSLTERANLQLPPLRNNTAFSSALSAIDFVNDTQSLGAKNMRIAINTIPESSTLSRFDVFFVAYAAMIHMAPIPAGFPMNDFRTKSPSKQNVHLRMLRWGPGVDIYRAIQVMTFVPRAMMQTEHGFREVHIDLWLDGIRHLEADIHKGFL